MVQPFTHSQFGGYFHNPHPSVAPQWLPAEQRAMSKQELTKAANAISPVNIPASLKLLSSNEGGVGSERPVETKTHNCGSENDLLPRSHERDMPDNATHMNKIRICLPPIQAENNVKQNEAKAPQAEVTLSRADSPPERPLGFEGNVSCSDVDTSTDDKKGTLIAEGGLTVAKIKLPEHTGIHSPDSNAVGSGPPEAKEINDETIEKQTKLPSTAKESQPNELLSKNLNEISDTQTSRTTVEPTISEDDVTVTQSHPPIVTHKKGKKKQSGQSPKPKISQSTQSDRSSENSSRASSVKDFPRNEIPTCASPPEPAAIAQEMTPELHKGATANSKPKKRSKGSKKKKQRKASAAARDSTPQLIADLETRVPAERSESPAKRERDETLEQSLSSISTKRCKSNDVDIDIDIEMPDAVPLAISIEQNMAQSGGSQQGEGNVSSYRINAGGSLRMKKIRKDKLFPLHNGLDKLSICEDTTDASAVSTVPRRDKFDWPPSATSTASSFATAREAPTTSREGSGESSNSAHKPAPFIVDYRDPPNQPLAPKQPGSPSSRVAVIPRFPVVQPPAAFPSGRSSRGSTASPTLSNGRSTPEELPSLEERLPPPSMSETFPHLGKQLELLVVAQKTVEAVNNIVIASESIDDKQASGMPQQESAVLEDNHTRKNSGQQRGNNRRGHTHFNNRNKPAYSKSGFAKLLNHKTLNSPDASHITSPSLSKEWPGLSATSTAAKNQTASEETAEAQKNKDNSRLARPKSNAVATSPNNIELGTRRKGGNAGSSINQPGVQDTNASEQLAEEWGEESSECSGGSKRTKGIQTVAAGIDVEGA
jgi:hypothetical protein